MIAPVGSPTEWVDWHRRYSRIWLERSEETPLDFVPEHFTDEERAVLAPYFTNLEGPVFALVNLPEVVKGALFARYSRSPKSLRRLFLDEFAQAVPEPAEARGGHEVGVGRAERLYERVFVEYGDDSVAQLGGAHLACEQVSQILAKVLEWGRLAAYLEQSTRYIPYNDRPAGRWRYIVPEEVRLGMGRELPKRFRETLDADFQVYSDWLDPMQKFLEGLVPMRAGDSESVYRASIRGRVCDSLRGLLPAATKSNIGIFGSAQSYEQLLLRMRAHPLGEVRSCAKAVLTELRKVIPAFLRRVDMAQRGVEWSSYLRSVQHATEVATLRALGDACGPDPSAGPRVTLVDHDPLGEEKVVAAAMYSASCLSEADLQARVERMGYEDRAAILRAYVGHRANRRHKPGRAFERTAYRFDVVCDYGSFRDLQRHRLLTIEWQELSPVHSYHLPSEVEEVGAAADWEKTMARSREMYDELVALGLASAAPYALNLAYRVRFTMQMNAREAMHLLELRSTPQGHPVYRSIAQQMHKLIADRHPGIGAAMRFVDYSAGRWGRLDSERRSEHRRPKEQLALFASE